jgi:hypothetical protein
MASFVDICNMGLSHIGDSANVTSIDPPDGSVQAGYCATFLPIALAVILQSHDWSFATVRSQTAAVWSSRASGCWDPIACTWTTSPLPVNATATWRFAYAYPANVVKMISVLPQCALDDYSANFGERNADWNAPQPDFANPAANMYMPQPYAIEQDGAGNMLILTNEWNPVFRCIINTSDPTQFGGLFVLALSYLLASMLAGPIIKGDEGAQQSAAMMAKYGGFQGQAAAADSSQRHVEVRQRVSWMAGR